MPFRGTSKQRLEVWRGTREKTSGGLRKADLIKNKRGKLVSKKKSTQAASQNNLGDHLRAAGKKIAKAEMLHPKKGKSGKKKASSPEAKVVPKAKAAPKPAAKPAPKPAPKAAPKPKPKPAQKRAPKAKPAKAKRIKKKSNINPLTNQPRDPDAKAKVSLDNVKRHRARPKQVDIGGW